MMGSYVGVLVFLFAVPALFRGLVMSSLGKCSSIARVRNLLKQIMVLWIVFYLEGNHIFTVLNY